MSEELVALIREREIGRVRQERRGRLSFTYNEDWRQARGAFPLSLSMPLAATEHGDKPVTAFLWGLLPDNEYVLSRWATRFHVSARNPFALLSHVGHDCAGAIQFVRSESLEEWLKQESGAVEWLSDEQVAERLRILRDDQSAWRMPRDTGQFSLAGAQPKTALMLEDDRWGVPSGRTPTTHILKPPTGEFDGHAENEHFCLILARQLGLPTASSKVMEFNGEKAIVVERYDRFRRDGKVLRIHQEDVCQALAVSPTRKYQGEGGPGPADVIELLRQTSSHSEEDVATFVDALIFNWLIAGTDAHAKNYSLLLGTSGRVRLSPLYDLASALPYDSMDYQKLKLAMKVGRHYRIRDIRLRDWQHLAKESQLSEAEVLPRIAQLSNQIPDASETIRKECGDLGLDHGILDSLNERLTKRANQCNELVTKTVTED